MAWQHNHYYRKKWVDGTCVSEHIGTGVIGELAAAVDEAERLRQRAQDELYRRMVEADNALIKQISEIGAIVRNLTKLVLIVDGYHQHKRQWRGRGMGEALTLKLPTNRDKMGISAAELNALIARIDTGNPTEADRKELARCLYNVPGFAALLGDLATVVCEVMINKSHNNSPSMQQAASVHFVNMRDGLGYENATAIEQSIILHIVVCWFRLQYVEHQFNQHTFGQHSIKEGQYWDRRLSAAQRRYLRAVESLERVRKLMRPDSPSMAVQVNLSDSIGKNQG